MASIDGGAGAVDLGNVLTETSAKSSNLINFPMPLEDSSAALLMDLFGASRTITVDGVITGVVADLRTFVEQIETIQNGSQSGSTFISSWTNANKTVLIQDFTHTKTEGDESKVRYSLTLVQGNPL